MPYRLDESTGYIDYDALEKSAQLFRPKLIIAGEKGGCGWRKGGEEAWGAREKDEEVTQQLGDARRGVLGGVWCLCVWQSGGRMHE
jgi:hypothetical protein